MASSSPISPVRARLRAPLAAVLAAALADDAGAVEYKVAGRVVMGAVWRIEAPDPALQYTVNAAARGAPGTAPAGQNTDDGNNNYARGDVVSRALIGHLDLSASSGSASALLRVRAWHDDALAHDARPWGNNPNRYQAGAPLSDAGSARLARFSGVALGDAYLEDTLRIGRWRLLGRLGQQSLAWGSRALTGSGIGAINAVDLPALRRAGTTPQDFRVPQPMLFARLGREDSGWSLEGFWQTGFKPGVLDMCGTFWAATDYLPEGCDRAFAGPPVAGDRQRSASGHYLKRVDSPYSLDAPQYGVGVAWKSPQPGIELGLYYARYINRLPTPGLRKSGRIGGPAVVAGDPDGRNLAFFAGHVPAIEMVGVNLFRQHGATGWYTELTYRANQPVQLPSGDVLSAFLNPLAASPLRLDADRIGPGGYFHAYDRMRTAQLQVSAQRDMGRVGKVAINGGIDVVFKHAFGLPDPAVRRYGRADLYGGGPYRGVCGAGSVPVAARQCTLDGYVTPNAWGYRIRLDLNFGPVAPALDLRAGVMFAHEVSGWSYDFQLNRGRRTANLALRAEYSRRYLAELAYTPVWGGPYNNIADRDQLSFMVGVKF